MVDMCYDHMVSFCATIVFLNLIVLRANLLIGINLYFKTVYHDKSIS